VLFDKNYLEKVKISVQLEDTLDKEEVIRAIQREGNCRVPIWYNMFCQGFLEKYEDEVNLLLNEYPEDVIVINVKIGAVKAYGVGEESIDEWGVVWKTSPFGAGAARVKSPLDDWSNLELVLENNVPDPDSDDVYADIDKARKENPKKYIVAARWFGPFELLRALRGTANTLVDLYINREKVQRLGSVFLDLNLRIIKNCAERGVDGMLFGDDYGTQEALFMRPSIWREIFKPWHIIMVKEIHKYGMHAILHSCGNITEIFQDLIEVGYDVIHPIQPQAMDNEEIAKRFKGKVSFCGGVDVQGFLPYGTVEEVDIGIKRSFEIFTSVKGGFIAAPTNSITPETPIENVIAMCKALKKYSRQFRAK